MDIGMLWFDNDQNMDLQAKIERAARYYHDKYGQTPNLCFVHPGLLPPSPPAEENADPVYLRQSGQWQCANINRRPWISYRTAPQ